jgi:tripartite-type tricarboxylate transporter receptor subunit TctC
MYSLALLRYDLLTDLRPVALLADGPFILVARKTMAASDLKQLMAWLKANPDKASQGTGGFGAAEHLAALLLQQQTGLRFQIVPYRGNSPAVQDLVGAQIDIMFADGAVGLPNLRAGLIKAYAVTAKNRLTAAPDIPTVDEVGLPGFYASLWYGLWAPARTSQEIVAKLNAAAADALADATVRARLVDLGFEIFPREQQKPAALAALQKAEIEKWWPIIKEFGIKGE